MKSGEDPSALLDGLANLAYQFGPFFFAVLFSLFITRTARRWYSEAAEGKEEKRAFRSYFHSSWVFGMLLVATSVVWWLRSQWEGHHAFAASIVALSQNQQLASISEDQNFYSRFWVHQTPDTLKDSWFVIVSDHPVRRGEVFKLNYWEGNGIGGIGQQPQTTTIQIRVIDPTKFPQKYMLVKNGQKLEAVPYDN